MAVNTVSEYVKNDLHNSPPHVHTFGYSLLRQTLAQATSLALANGKIANVVANRGWKNVHSLRVCPLAVGNSSNTMKESRASVLEDEGPGKDRSQPSQHPSIQLGPHRCE